MFIGAAAAHREAANSSFPVKLIWINFDKLTSNYLFENGQDTIGMSWIGRWYD